VTAFVKDLNSLYIGTTTYNCGVRQKGGKIKQIFVYLEKVGDESMRCGDGSVLVGTTGEKSLIKFDRMVR
jgi:hypothetical protein